MIQILDRYLLRQFLQVMFICFCSLTGLYIVIDGFGNLEDFILYAEKQGVNLLALMGEYYGYRSLSFFDRTSGVLALIAAMFTVTWIQRHNELTAIQAAGISKGRVLKPVIIAVIVFSGLSAANRELVIPAIRHKLSHNAQNLAGSSGMDLQPRYDNATVILLSGLQTFADQQRILKPTFDLPANLDEIGKQVTGEEAFYQAPTADRPGGYLFPAVQRPRGLDKRPSASLNGQPVILTPYDTPWLKPGECFVASNVSFEQLEGGSSWRQYSAIWELISGLSNKSLNFGADVRVAVHARLVQPLLDVTLMFLGLPLVLSRGNRDMYRAIALCVLIVLLFMLVVMGCQYLGSSYWINPALAAWLPLMIFVPWAVGTAQPLFE